MQSEIRETLSVGEAARLLMLSRQRIVQLEHEGLWRRVDGKLRLEDLVPAYIRYLRDEARRSSKSAAQSRLSEARAAEIELRTKERARKLVRIDDVLALGDAVVKAVRTEMPGIGWAVTQDLALSQRIEDRLNQALDRVSDLVAERGRALRNK